VVLGHRMDTQFGFFQPRTIRRKKRRSDTLILLAHRKRNRAAKQKAKRTAEQTRRIIRISPAPHNSSCKALNNRAKEIPKPDQAPPGGQGFHELDDRSSGVLWTIVGCSAGRPIAEKKPAKNNGDCGRCRSADASRLILGTTSCGC